MNDNKKIKITDFFGGDSSLWMVILLLCVASILVVYSSTASMAYKELDGDTSHYLRRQIQFVLTGLTVTFFVHRFSYQTYFKWAKYIFYISLIPLCLTFFFGETYNETARWIRIPYTTFTFQPSDVVKITLVMILAQQLAIRQHMISKIPVLPSLNYSRWQTAPERNSKILFKVTIPLLFPVFITAVMIMITNLSTAIIVGVTSVIVLIIGRVRMKEIWRLVMLVVVCFLLIATSLKMAGVGRVDTWISRLENFFVDTKETDNSKEISADQFQKHQAKIAVAAGWLGGVGPGHSTQRSNLPHPYSDYAYAFIIEEYGLFGALIILGCYIWIFYRSIVIFHKCETAFPALLVLGLGLMTTIQAMLHMIVSVDAGPVTGQTLPIISLGGSSLITTCASLGIILGISRQQNEKSKYRALGEQRKLVLEEWDQVEMDESQKEEWEGVIIEEEEDDIRAEDIESIEELDIKMQHNRLEKALNEEKYQAVIWDEDTSKDLKTKK